MSEREIFRSFFIYGGINEVSNSRKAKCSSYYSCIYKETYSVGRVQTPTLYLIAKRDSEINLFKKQKYYTVDLSYGGLKLVSDRIDEIEGAEQLFVM